jgi:hypothetical protein
VRVRVEGEGKGEGEGECLGLPMTKMLSNANAFTGNIDG